MKGNRDVTDALLPMQTGCRSVGGAASSPVDGKYEGRFDVQIRHEAGARADLVLQTHQAVPAEIVKQGFNLDCDWIKAQFQSGLFSERADAVVLSLQSSIVDRLWKHREKNYLLCPEGGWEEKWNPEQRQWLADTFSPVGLLRADEFEQCFQLLVRTLRERSGAPVLVLNCSSIDPADTVFRYRGVGEDTWSVRAQKFNLALMRISALEGVSIIDVDRILGEMGADRHVSECACYSEEASRVIRQECLRVMEDIGVFHDSGPIAEDRLQKEKGKGLRLVMPFVNRLSHRGIIVRWHKKVGDCVRFGDDLLDIDMQVGGVPAMSRGERIQYLVKPQDSAPGNNRTGEKGDGPGAVISVRVTSADSGFLRRVDAPEGSEKNVNDLLAMMATDAATVLIDGDDAASMAVTFRVAVNLAS